MCPNQVRILNVAYLTTSITLTEVFRYLLSPVEALFQTILENGLEKRFEGEPNWKHWLQPQYHHFSGDYPGFNGRHGETFRFVESAAYPIALMMAPPSGKQYGKCRRGYIMHRMSPGSTLRICSLCLLLLTPFVSLRSSWRKVILSICLETLSRSQLSNFCYDPCKVSLLEKTTHIFPMSLHGMRKSWNVSSSVQTQHPRPLCQKQGHTRRVCWSLQEMIHKPSHKKSIFQATMQVTISESWVMGTIIELRG